MKKFILLLTAVFGLGVVAQAADPSPSASGAPKKHHHHKASSTTSPSKPAASPKASASPKT
jgi:hypothetical protein